MQPGYFSIASTNITEGMRVQAKACLVVLRSAGAIFECPAGMFRASRLVNEMPDGILFMPPEPAHPAGLSVLAPKLEIDVSVFVHGQPCRADPAGNSLERAS